MAVHLDSVAASIDAINVYPVPDGDTGSNMSATVREAAAVVGELSDDVTSGELFASLAKASLYSARGNSGVILSQAFRGMATALADSVRVSGDLLAKALVAGATASYGAVSEPKEGTMLTVLRAAGEGASSGSFEDARDVLARGLSAAEVAAANTINQMDLLREAGVTDAGGEGVCAVRRGILASIDGTAPKAPPSPTTTVALRPEHEIDSFGFCTEFVLEAGERDLAKASVEDLATMAGGRSLVTVGDERTLRVHVHVDKPEQLLRDMGRFGTVTRPKFDDMAYQHQQLQRTGSGAKAPVALLALCQGDGFHALFGAHTLELGLEAKPSAGEIAGAADGIGARKVIVLPNHANVLLAANQAVELARTELLVVPTVGMAEGLSAAVAFDGSGDAESAARTMASSAADVAAVEVSRADAERTVSGVSVRIGDWIAMVRGSLVAAGADLDSIVLTGLEAAGASEAELATVYAGTAFTDTQLQALERDIAAAYPEIEVQSLGGGQTVQDVIVAVE